jgi:hypothetical protein
VTTVSAMKAALRHVVVTIVMKTTVTVVKAMAKVIFKEEAASESRITWIGVIRVGVIWIVIGGLLLGRGTGRQANSHHSKKRCLCENRLNAFHDNLLGYRLVDTRPTIRLGGA